MMLFRTTILAATAVIFLAPATASAQMQTPSDSMNGGSSSAPADGSNDMLLRPGQDMPGGTTPGGTETAPGSTFPDPAAGPLDPSGNAPGQTTDPLGTAPDAGSSGGSSSGMGQGSMD